jgi:hypothetical protein
MARELKGSHIFEQGQGARIRRQRKVQLIYNNFAVRREILTDEFDVQITLDHPSQAAYAQAH